MSGDVFWEYLIYVKFVCFDMRVESEWERKVKGNMTVPHKILFPYLYCLCISFKSRLRNDDSYHVSKISGSPYHFTVHG